MKKTTGTKNLTVVSSHKMPCTGSMGREDPMDVIVQVLSDGSQVPRGCQYYHEGDGYRSHECHRDGRRRPDDPRVARSGQMDYSRCKLYVRPLS